MTRKEGVVLKGTGGVWHVRADSGETHEASLRGRLKQERKEDRKLAVGDRVVVDGQNQLKPGARIKPTQAGAAKKP